MAEQPADGQEIDATWPPRVRWWQHPAARVTAGVLTFAVMLVPWFLIDPADPWDVPLGAGAYLVVTRKSYDVFAGLLLMPFLRKASYRRRDVLIIWLVPLYGEYVAAKVVTRLLFLPLRDWPARPDEVPRAVRVPKGRGIYVLRGTFADAERLRERWCRNPQHHHPYPRWSAATQVGCTKPELTPPAAVAPDAP